MTQITPIECYSELQAIKMHFSGSYDYFKYGGKVSITPASFEAKRDHMTYTWIAKKYNKENYHDLVLSNVLRKPNIYCRELLSEESRETLLEYQKRIQGLSYNFGTDIDHLMDLCAKEKCTLDDMLRVESGSPPKLLKQYEWRYITLETLVILDDILGFFGYWDKRIQDRIIWPGIHNLCTKYKPFLTYDKDSLRKILKEKIFHWCF